MAGFTYFRTYNNRDHEIVCPPFGDFVGCIGLYPSCIKIKGEIQVFRTCDTVDTSKTMLFGEKGMNRERKCSFSFACEIQSHFSR